MHPSHLLASASSILPYVASQPHPHPNHCGPYVSATEGLTQAGYKTGWIIDGKSFSALPEVFMPDLIYDSTNLGEDYGGRTEGIEGSTAALKAAGDGAKREHLVTNLYVKEMLNLIKARVITYITLTHWNKDALDDIKKAFRIYHSCDDIWVCQDGGWKMQKSYVINMGPDVEAPYLGKNNPLLSG